MTATVTDLTAAQEHRPARQMRHRNRQVAGCRYCPLFVDKHHRIHVCDAMLGQPYGVSL